MNTLREWVELLAKEGVPLPDSVRLGDRDDEGTLSWTEGPHSLELELTPGISPSFFYRNRKSSEVLMEDPVEMVIPPLIVQKLKHFK